MLGRERLRTEAPGDLAEEQLLALVRRHHGRLAGVVGIDEAGEDAGLRHALRIARIRGLAHDRDVIVGRAGEAVVAPERPRIDHRHLDDEALRPALRDLHRGSPAMTAHTRSRPRGSAGSRRSRGAPRRSAHRNARSRPGRSTRSCAPAAPSRSEPRASRRHGGRRSACRRSTRSACAGPNSASMLSQARISQPRCSIEISSALALGTEPTSVAISLRTLSFSTFSRSHSREGQAVEPHRVGVRPRRLAVDRQREVVHRLLGLGVDVAAGKARVGIVLDAVYSSPPSRLRCSVTRPPPGDG